MGIMGTFCTFLFLLYLIMIPSDHTSGEMKVAYYILVVPEWLKLASAYSFIGFLLLLPIYSMSKTHQAALLVIDENTFQISGAQMDKTIHVDSIRKIMINDVRRIFRKPKEVIEVVIKQGPSRTTSFLLRHHEQAEELIEVLSNYQNIEFVFYNDFSMTTYDDD